METLDIERADLLVAWLRREGHIGADESPGIRVLAGGVSNRTVWVARPRGETWVLKQALEKLRVAEPWFCSPERIHREALGMRWLATLAPPGAVPELLFEHQEYHLLGMRAVPEPHSNWKTILLAGVVEPDHVRQFGQLLGSIHRRSILVRSRLEPVFEDARYFEALRLQPFYAFPAANIPEAAKFLNDLILETRAVRTGLVHGDFSPKNILIHREQLVLLDHEVIHWGDPMFDLGFALAHLLSKAHHSGSARESLAGAAVLFWEHYQFSACPCLAGAENEARAARHAVACLLARAVGKSPVDYLDSAARKRQAAACLTIMKTPPRDIVSLADRFLREIGARETTPSIPHAHHTSTRSPRDSG